ncbi:MAG: NADH-quinone oxidoreductase subunit D [Symbiobacteriia bacterium]
MGPQHPSTHGVLRVIVKLDGETVVQAKPDVGYLHRCFEKLSEQKTYTQVIPFTDRTDYLGAMTNEWAFVLGIEKLLGLVIPERAEYLRVIVAELQRIASHLLWFGTFSLDLGAATPFLYAFREREVVYDLFEALSGGRLLYNYFRIGGLRNDLPPGWTEKVIEFLDYLEKKALPEYHALFTTNAIVHARTLGIGKLTPEDAIAWGASGPVLRGSGVNWDLRRDAPYGYYHKFEWDVVTEAGCDVNARFLVRMREMVQSARILRQAIAALPDGEYMGKVPKVLRPAKDSEAYIRHEGPRGEIGVYMIADGTANPYRVHWRSPAFVHLQLIEHMAIGDKIADLVATIGSIDIVLGEVDR